MNSSVRTTITVENKIVLRWGELLEFIKDRGIDISNIKQIELGSLINGEINDVVHRTLCNGDKIILTIRDSKIQKG